MSILIANVAGTCLTRTSDVLDCASAFTMMAWIYMPSGRTWATNYLALWPSEYHYYFCNIRRDGSNLKLRLRSPSTGTDDTTLNTTISTDVWYHVAVTRKDNSFELFVDGASIGTTTYSDSLSTYSMAIGEPDGTGTQDYVQDAKFWARQLSLAEIQAEMRSRRPVTWDSLYAWYPLIGDSNLYLDDYSGRSRDWTATNAPTMGTIGPAVAYRAQETLFWPPTAAAAGAQSVTPSGIASGEAIGAATVTRGAVTVVPGAIGTAEAFGTPTVARGAVTVGPTGISSSEGFGSPAIGRGAVALGPSGISSLEAFGTATMSGGAAVVSPTGIPGAETFGVAAVTRGTVTVNPAGVASLEAVGSPVLGLAVAPGGIASAEGFGLASVLLGAAQIRLSGVASLEAFGTPVLSGGAAPQAAPGAPPLAVPMGPHAPRRRITRRGDWWGGWWTGR